MASAARLNVRMRPCAIGRREPAREAVDDVLVERLQVGDLARRPLEPRAGALQPIGKRAAEKGDREEQEDVEARRVRHDAERRQRCRRDRETARRAVRPARSTASSTMPTYSSALSVAIIMPPRRNCTLLAAAIGST